MLGLCFALDDDGFPSFCGSYDGAMRCDGATRRELGLGSVCARGMLEHAGFCDAPGVPTFCGSPGRAVCGPDAKRRFGVGDCQPGLRPVEGICAYGPSEIAKRIVSSETSCTDSRSSRSRRTRIGIRRSF